MKGENIISFSKDWTEDPTSNNHVMRRLAKENTVLWLNSISTRAPNLSSGRDLKKIVTKLGAFFRGARHEGDRLWVYTPLVLPLPHSPWATRANRLLLRFMLGRLRRQLGMTEFQLWTFLPNATEYVGTLGEAVSVYYCTDEWSKFTGVNERKMADAERELCRKVDILFATAQSLLDNRRPLNLECHLATHGVEVEKFARALDDATPLPADLADLPRPILGFYGLLEDWLDYDLLVTLARRRPDWTFVLLGKAVVDVSRLEAVPNVRLLGRKPHDELPAYCKAFDVGLIPYQLTERLLHVNPIKLREYLCAGLPVVSAALPEVERYQPLCAIARTPDEWERAIEDALKADTPEARRARSAAMRDESWDRKVEELSEQVMRVKCAKTSARSA